MAFILSNHSGKNKSIILEDSKANEQLDQQPDVQPRSLTLYQGVRSALTVIPTEGWEFISSDDRVAIVSLTGTVTGVNIGTAIITCTHKESETQITVSVQVTGKTGGKQ